MRKSLSATTVRTKKRTSQKNSHVDGPYLQVRSYNVTVSAPSHTFTSVSQASGVSDLNQAILSALTRLEAANQDLARRMERMESGGNTNSTPVQSPDLGRQLVLISCLRDPDWVGIPPRFPLRGLIHKYHTVVGEERYLLLLIPYPVHHLQISLTHCHTVLPLHTLKPWKPVGMSSFHQWMLLELFQVSHRLCRNIWPV